MDGSKEHRKSRTVRIKRLERMEFFEPRRLWPRGGISYNRGNLHDVRRVGSEKPAELCAKRARRGGTTHRFLESKSAGKIPVVIAAPHLFFEFSHDTAGRRPTE